MTNPQNWAEVEKEFYDKFFYKRTPVDEMPYLEFNVLKQGSVAVLIEFLHDKLLEAEKMGAERAVDYIQEAKLPIFSAKTSLFDGNKVLSQVSEDMVVKVQDLMEVLKAARESKGAESV